MHQFAPRVACDHDGAVTFTWTRRRGVLQYGDDVSEEVYTTRPHLHVAAVDWVGVDDQRQLCGGRIRQQTHGEFDCGRIQVERFDDAQVGPLEHLSDKFLPSTNFVNPYTTRKQRRRLWSVICRPLRVGIRS